MISCSKTTNDRYSNLSEILSQKTPLLPNVRYLYFRVICSSLCGITCSNYMYSEYMITTLLFEKYFEFYKPFVNFIFTSLDTIFSEVEWRIRPLKPRPRTLKKIQGHSKKSKAKVRLLEVRPSRGQGHKAQPFSEKKVHETIFHATSKKKVFANFSQDFCCSKIKSKEGHGHGPFLINRKK